MITFVRKRFTLANLVAAAALVFAMAGGAYATSGNGHHGRNAKHKAKHNAEHGYVITSTKQIKPLVLKALSGDAGPVGPAGPTGLHGEIGAPGIQGLQGEKGGPGIQGLQGEKGAQGNAGENVEVTSLVAGMEPEPATECKGRGGGKFTNVTGVAYACNGESSAGGGSSELQSGETESGEWSAELVANFFGGLYHGGNASITFPRPVATSIASSLYVKEGEVGVANCPGTAAQPEAAPGYLCIYAEAESAVELVSPNQARAFGQRTTFLNAKEGGGYAYGSWAVTAQ